MHRNLIATRTELLDLRDQLFIISADDRQDDIVPGFHRQITRKIGNCFAFLMHRTGTDAVVEFIQLRRNNAAFRECVLNTLT